MKFFQCLIIISLSLFLYLCVGNVAPFSDNDNSYPLKIGNTWEYSRQFNFTNFRDPNGNPAIPWFNISIQANVLVTAERLDTLLTSHLVVVLKEIYTEAGQTIEGEAFYANQEDGLYFYAYNGQSMVNPKSGFGNKIFFKGVYFNHISEVTDFIEKKFYNSKTNSDSIIYEIPPLLSLKYPLQVGDQWIYRTWCNPWRIDKKVAGKENISVPCGYYETYKIQWMLDIWNDGNRDKDIEFFDYICREGLVKRTVLFKDMFAVDENNNPLGIFDALDEMELTNYNL